MPGATPVFGLPYPFMDEGATVADFQALALAIDALAGSLVTSTNELLARPYLDIDYAINSITIATGVETSVPWTFNASDNFNNDGMWTSAAPTLITVQTPGVYMVAVQRATLTGWATCASSRNAIFLNGVFQFGERKIPTANATTPDNGANGLIVCQTGDVVTNRVLWLGTGGPATLVRSHLQMRFVCPL